MSIDFPRLPGESSAVFTSPRMNRCVSGLHLIVRTRIHRGRHGAGGSHSIAALLELNTTCDLKFARDARIMVEHHVQAPLAFEARVELVKQFADPGGKIRHGRATAHDGDRLFRNLLYLDGV